MFTRLTEPSPDQMRAHFTRSPARRLTQGELLGSTEADSTTARQNGLRQMPTKPASRKAKAGKFLEPPTQAAEMFRAACTPVFPPMISRLYRCRVTPCTNMLADGAGPLRCKCGRLDSVLCHTIPSDPAL